MAKPTAASQTARAEEQALLAEIAHSTDDNTARLVTADLLDADARGQEDQARAELIRLQCRAAELGTTGVDWHREVGPDGREEALLKKHRKRWLEALPKWARAQGKRFHRGFPAEVHLSGNVEELVRLAEKWKDV